MYDYILFDLDGTLTDSAPGIINSVMYALNKMNIEVRDRNELFTFIGPPLIESFSRYCNFSREEAENAVKEYRVYYEKSGIYENRVFPGIPEVLEKLKKSGKKLIVATSKPEPYSMKIIDYFGLSKYFDFLGGANMDEKRSEKWEVIQYILDTNGITDYSKVLMIGDRKHDINGGKRVGIHTLGVLYGYGGLQELKEAGADYIAETVEDIPGFC